MKQFIALFINLTFTLFVFAQDENRALTTWQVQKYDINAVLPQSETDRNLTVKAILTLKNISSSAASRLTLRISPSAEVSAVKVNDAAADFTKGEEKIDANRILQRIIVRVPSIQPGANFTIAVDYKLNVKENSGLNALSPIGSQFLPLSFWYPTPNSWYFTRGADYAPVRLQINSANGETVISSGANNANAFEQKLSGQPFFVSGNWDAVNAGGITIYLQKGASADEQQRANELASLSAEAKAYTTNLLGNAPDTPLRIVSVKRGAGFSSGGTIFVDGSAFRRQKIDAQTAMTIAESVAKTWIGNAVPVGGDGFGVINEGLPQFIATQFLESKYGKEIADIERLRQRTAYAAIVKRDAPLTKVSPLDDYYFAAVSNKSAMIWRLLVERVGREEFYRVLQSQMKDGSLDLNKLRTAFVAQKDFLDYSFDQVTDMNLLIGLPQSSGAETKIALRNLGAIDAVAVNIMATTANGEKLKAQSTIRAKSFGEATFKTTNKIIRAEVDTDKFYPQTDYSDDVAPRDFNESDALAVIKRAFDKQDYAAAEKNARTALNSYPRFDDARTWLARALSAKGKTAEAEKEYRAILDEKLPTARSLSWANVGLGEIALKANQNAPATQFFNSAINANAEYGATLAARVGLNKIGSTLTIDESIRAFFTQFDKAAISGRKADVDALILSGEISRFSGGISGQAQEWTTKVLRVDKTDASTAVAEVSLNIRLLNKEAENGTAVFLLSRVGNTWKLSGVESFEVR